MRISIEQYHGGPWVVTTPTKATPIPVTEPGAGPTLPDPFDKFDAFEDARAFAKAWKRGAEHMGGKVSIIVVV